MTISKDLFLAILSMDAYNRGYGAGMSDGGAGDSDGLGESGQIGKATISFALDDVSQTFANDAEAAGFYAIAYTINGSGYGDLAAGDTVISYRGTDSLLGLGEGGSDVWSGWITGAGVQGSQSSLALDFFEAVTGTDALQLEGSGITTTGHSLGGGLAGFVAALSGDDAVVFDNMPLKAAA